RRTRVASQDSAQRAPITALTRASEVGEGMTFHYCLSSDGGNSRLLIPGTVYASAVFSDEELTALLTLESASVRRAAAMALETIAATETSTENVLKLLDVQTDGATELAAR